MFEDLIEETERLKALRESAARARTEDAIARRRGGHVMEIRKRLHATLGVKYAPAIDNAEPSYRSAGDEFPLLTIGDVSFAAVESMGAGRVRLATVCPKCRARLYGPPITDDPQGSAMNRERIVDAVQGRVQWSSYWLSGGPHECPANERRVWSLVDPHGQGTEIPLRAARDEREAVAEGFRALGYRLVSRMEKIPKP